MSTAYLPLRQSEQLDEDEDVAILEMLQSSDAECSSDEDLSPSSNGKVSHDPSPDDASVWKTVANLVNYIEGVGFLALPYVLKEGGIGALVAFIIIPIILWYMGTIVTECLYEEDSQGRKIRVRSGYKDLGDALLPKYGGYVLSGFVQIFLFLLAVTYLILFGSTMYNALPSVPITELMWISIAGGLVLPTTFLKSLSQIAWLSVISVIALVAVVVAVVWYGTEHASEWKMGQVLFWNSEGTLMSLSVILYSYSVFLVIPSLEGSMVEKEKFGRALALAYIVRIIIKLSFSVLAFLSFGANTDEIVVNNLPPGPVHITVSSFFAFSCILSYVLVVFPILENIHNSVTTRIQNDEIPSFLTYAVVRVTLVLMTVAVPILVPSFLVIVMFLGGTLGSIECYIFPVVLHLKLKYKKLNSYQVGVDIFVACFGVVALIFGIAMSIKTLIKVYQQ